MPDVTPDDIYKDEVTKEMQSITGNPNLTINFQGGALSQHVANDNQARSSIMNATNASSVRLGEGDLNQQGIDHIFSKVARSTTYSTVLGVMDRAISIGTGSEL